jgi:actin-related protein
MMMDMPETELETDAVVLDCGSGTVKCGFAGEDAPRSVFETVIQAPTEGGRGAVGALGESKDGVTAEGGEGGMGGGGAGWRGRVIRPINRAVVDGDWDSMTAIWEHAFQNGS